jgi:hypothetical protein
MTRGTDRLIPDALRRALPRLRLPALRRPVDIPVYLIHNSPDAEDYFFIFDFEQFVARSRAGLFVRPRIRVWAGRADFSRRRFARQFREGFAKEVDAARATLQAEDRKGNGWFGWIVATDLNLPVGWVPNLVANIVLSVALSGTRALFLGFGRRGAARTNDDPEKLERAIEDTQRKVDAALEALAIHLHVDLYRHAWRGATPGSLEGIDHEAWPLPAFVRHDPDREPGRDRLPRDRHRREIAWARAGWGWLASPSIPTPMRVRGMWRWPTRRCISAVRRRPRAICGAMRSSPPRWKPAREAIHPGYGFLSENPDFVEAVAAAGLTFIGPSAAAIRAMGLKDAAKALMAEAGVPVVPGYHGQNQDPEHLSGAADAIGYPVLIKAVAGGGGKGMRRVARPQDFMDALQAPGARRDRLWQRRGADREIVEKPRHIEVQVFGDGTDAVHLFERDCSLQRRHQKVIEEAPAPGMTEEMRAAMGRPRAGRPRHRLSGRGHGRVHRRWLRRAAPRPVLVHGDEHKAAGRASGDRGDHRR